MSNDTPMPAYGFKFISGKYQGGEFPIPDDGSLVIGRASDADLVLAEDMVSRKHAKIAAANAKLSLADLGSTNGTFVNGEKIQKASLRRNDRVLIGTSILKVIDGADLSIGRQKTDKESLREMMAELGSREQESSTMSGDLEEVPLPDLLQLFSTNRKSGVLTITGDHRGKLYIKEGQLQFAVIQSDVSMPAKKALYRMIGWESGSFSLEAYDEDASFKETFSEKTEGLIMDALRQQDELNNLLSRLPPTDSSLNLCLPMTAKLRDLEPPELDALQHVLNFGQIQQVMDNSPDTDLDALSGLEQLLRDGYLETD